MHRIGNGEGGLSRGLELVKAFLNSPIKHNRKQVVSILLNNPLNFS